jgi:cyclic pyranopterin phosphate synthase
MCHQLNITAVEIELTPQKSLPASISKPGSVSVKPVSGWKRAAVSVAGLTIYDMCKAVDREMAIGEIRLVKKRQQEQHVYS